MVTAAPIRGWRERVIQTLAFELGGLLIVGPLWKFAVGATATESIVLLICLSVAVMCWMSLYNTLFDIVEFRIARRVASDRPHRLRVAHAIGLEVTSAIVTWPLIMLLTELNWFEALLADLGLTIAYAVYGYFFHLAFDHVHPVVTTTTPASPLAGVTE